MYTARARCCLRTARSTSSVVRTVAAPPRGKVHLYLGDKCCIPSVCLSVCFVSKIYSKSECRNFKFIGDTLVVTGRDFHGFND